MLDAKASVTVLFQFPQAGNMDVALIKVKLDFDTKNLKKIKGNNNSQPDSISQGYPEQDVQWRASDRKGYIQSGTTVYQIY